MSGKEQALLKCEGGGAPEEDVDHWKVYENDEFPDVFSHLELAHDGGFSEAHELYDSSRWATAALLIIFILYNVYSLVVLDSNFIYDPLNAHNLTAYPYPPEVMHTLNADWYISTTMFGQTEGLHPVQVLGSLELLGLTFFIVESVWYCIQIARDDGKKRWYAIAFLFWDSMPTLSVYSAMKLLDKIVPSKFSANLMIEIAFAQERAARKGLGYVKALTGILWFFFMTFVCFIIGFDTFLLKIRVVSSAIGGATFKWAQFLVCIQFLVQILGVVQLGPFVRQRLFIFIFAGEDGILQETERELMYTWNALLARKMYRLYTFPQWLAVMMSFSDEDFQKLVLNEDEEQGK